jgi:hypothetical protein
LAGRHCGKFRLIAGEQDPLALLLAQLVRDQAVTALAGGNAITVTRELAPSALQRRQPNAQQDRQLTRPGAISHTLVQD